MCAIVDASVAFEVFGRKRTEAGIRFRSWLDGKQGQLVVGGRNLGELIQNGNFRRWFQEARRSGGRVRQLREEIVGEGEKQIDYRLLRSNDSHVVALALVSGARLLYTDDRGLQHDFTNQQVVPGAEGRIYTSRPAETRVQQEAAARRAAEARVAELEALLHRKPDRE